MWFDTIIENWAEFGVSGLLVWEFGKSVWRVLPTNSIKKIFSKGNNDILGSVTHGVNEMLTSGEIIYKKAEDLINELSIERTINKTKDEKIAQLIEVNTLLVAILPVNKALKENVYKVVKNIDSVNDILVKTLEQSIEIQGGIEAKVVEEDNSVDTKLSEV